MPKPSPLQRVPSPPKKPQRLEGDALFTWAQIIMQERQFSEQKQAFAVQQIQAAWRTPGEFLLTDDGYIISREEALKRLNQEPTSPPEESEASNQPPPPPV